MSEKISIVVNDSALQDWLSQYDRKSTKYEYLQVFKKYIPFLNSSIPKEDGMLWTPKLILEFRRLDLQSNDEKVKRRFENLHVEFADYLRSKGMAPLTVRTYCSIIEEFFKHNDLTLKLKRLQRKRISGSGGAVKQKLELTLEQIEKIIEQSDVKWKAVFGLAFCTGLRASDICNFKQAPFLTFKERGETKEPYYLGEITTIKNGVTAHPFIIEVVKKWIEYWLNELKTTDDYGMEKLLFPTYWNFEKLQRKSVNPNVVTYKLQKLAKTVGIVVPRGYRLGAHSFRAYFENTCKTKANIPEEKVGLIMGVQVPRGTYIHKDDLRTYYEKVIPFLWKQEFSSEMLEKQKVLEEKIRITGKALGEEIEERVKLEERIEDLEDPESFTSDTVVQNLLIQECKRKNILIKKDRIIELALPRLGVGSKDEWNQWYVDYFGTNDPNPDSYEEVKEHTIRCINYSLDKVVKRGVIEYVNNDGVVYIKYIYRSDRVRKKS